jgi:hypothetical protein
MPVKKDKFAGKDPEWVRRYLRSRGIGRPRGHQVKGAADELRYPAAVLRDWAPGEEIAAYRRGEPLFEADVWEWATWLVEDGKTTIWAALRSILETELRRLGSPKAFRHHYGITIAGARGDKDLVGVVIRRLLARDRRYKRYRQYRQLIAEKYRRRQRRAAAKLQ